MEKTGKMDGVKYEISYDVNITGSDRIHKIVVLASIRMMIDDRDYEINEQFVLEYPSSKNDVLLFVERIVNELLEKSRKIIENVDQSQILITYLQRMLLNRTKQVFDVKPAIKIYK